MLMALVMAFLVFGVILGRLDVRCIFPPFFFGRLVLVLDVFFGVCVCI